MYGIHHESLRRDIVSRLFDCKTFKPLSAVHLVEYCEAVWYILCCVRVPNFEG